MSFISKIFSKASDGILDSAKGIIETFVTSPEQKLEAQKMLFEAEKVANQQALDMENAFLKDKQSARELGKTDPWTPRVLTILFVIGYFGVVVFMFVMMRGLLSQETQMDNFTVAFISSIFGSFNTFIGMILAYYFGASKGGDDQADKIASSFKSSMEAKKDE